MSWETEFEEFMTDTITREAYVSQNNYGEASYGDAVTLKARVVRKPEVVTTAAGEVGSAVREVVSSAKIYCVGVTGWSTRDRVTLPDGSQPVIIAVHLYPDENGEHHEVVVV